MKGAVTFDEIDHDPPDEPVSIEPPFDHRMEGLCWCQPRYERVLNLSGDWDEIIIHRRLFDMEDA